MVSSEELGHAKEEVAFWQKLQQLHPFNPAQAVFDDTVAVLEGAEDVLVSPIIQYFTTL